MNHGTDMASMPLQKIAGFESTGYAMQHGRVVWAGKDAGTRHPRDARRPWQPAPFTGDVQRLRSGAAICIDQIGSLEPKGLLPWLGGQPLAFPMNHAAARLDAVRTALELDDIERFEAAALRLLGLGQGLTPSGDDFLGGIFFALAHAPRAAWLERLPGVKTRLCSAATSATNVISAALLEDLMQGASYGVLHDLMFALQGDTPEEIETATQALLGLGASSGADLLAGLLLALTTGPAPSTN